MKIHSALSLFLLATLSGPALAETPVAENPVAENPVKATPADVCPLAGPLTETTEACAALRSAFRAEVNDCMDQMHADSDARAGRLTESNSQTSRSRFLICNKGVREKMVVLVK